MAAVGEILKSAMDHVTDFSDVVLIVVILLLSYGVVGVWRMWTGDRVEHKVLTAARMEDCKTQVKDCLAEIDELEGRVKAAEARLLISLRMQIKAQGIYEDSIRGVGRIMPPKVKGCPEVCPVRSELPARLEAEIDRVSKAIEDLAPTEDN